MASPPPRVCVTGGGGFVASWLVKLLLSRGYAVHATVRDPCDPKNEFLTQLDRASENLRLFKADVLDSGTLAAAFAGCEGVFHMASPVPGDNIVDPELHQSEQLALIRSEQPLHRDNPLHENGSSGFLKSRERNEYVGGPIRGYGRDRGKSCKSFAAAAGAKCYSNRESRTAAAATAFWAAEQLLESYGASSFEISGSGGGRRAGIIVIIVALGNHIRVLPIFARPVDGLRTTLPASFILPSTCPRVACRCFL